jgi:flagella basal body P-ring formation protein FlgA
MRHVSAFVFMALLGSQSLYASPLQSAEAIVEGVSNYLMEQAESLAGTATITVTPPRLQQQPACESLSYAVPGNAALRSRMRVIVSCLAPETWTLPVQAALSIQGFYYVSNKTINKGELISLDDLITREGDLLRLPPNVVTDPSLIVGYMAGQRVNTGSTIKSTLLQNPQSVQRGQSVRTIARGNGFVISNEGQALQTAAPGSQVQVRVASGQVITGTVLDSSTVQVPL